MERNTFDGLPLFLEVARRKSFSAAAAHLGVSPSAASHTIRQLEERVGVPLFHRTTRSVELTAAGKQFYESVAPAAEEIGAALEVVREQTGHPSGNLRLTVPGIALPLVLDPLLQDFQGKYPDITVEISLNDALADIVGEGFDAGIRLGDMVEHDMVAVRLTGALRWVVVGAPSYFEKHGRPSRIEDLTSHACISYRQSASGRVYPWRLRRKGENVNVTVSGPLITNDTRVMLQAALDGMGLINFFGEITRPYEEAGKLERVLTTGNIQESGLFLCFPQRSRKLPALRAFTDFAKSAVASR